MECLGFETTPRNHQGSGQWPLPPCDKSKFGDEIIYISSLQSDMFMFHLVGAFNHIVKHMSQCNRSSQVNVKNLKPPSSHVVQTPKGVLVPQTH